MSKSRLNKLKERAEKALSGIDYAINETKKMTDADGAPIRDYQVFDDEDEAKEDAEVNPLKKPAVETIFQKALREFSTKCEDKNHADDSTLEADVIFFECIKYFHTNHIKTARSPFYLAKLDFSAFYCGPLAQYPQLDVRAAYLAIYSNIHNPWITIESFSQSETDKEAEKAMLRNLKLFFTKAQCLLVLQLTRSLPFTDDRELGVVIKNLAIVKKFAGNKKDTTVNDIISNSTLNSQKKFYSLVHWIEDQCFKAQHDYYQESFLKRKYPGDYAKYLNSQLDSCDYERMLYLTLEDVYTVCDGRGTDELMHVFPDLNHRISPALQKGKKPEYQFTETISEISRPTKQLP